MEYITLVIFIIMLLVGVFLIFKYSRKKKLSNERKNYYRKEIQRASVLPSPNEQILHIDKILHHILKDYGYSGTVGDQLKAKPRVIYNLDTIWNLHKLRNTLAHSLETVSEELLERKADEFEKELLKLL